MEATILGSGGCTVIPKPLCRCPVCTEARLKGGRYARSGPSLFLHDSHVLIDTPAEAAAQLNREGIGRLDTVMFTHLDPDHVEGFRVVEQIALDFRSWKAYPEKRIRLLLPSHVSRDLRRVQSVYGPLIDFYEQQGFVETVVFGGATILDHLRITAIPVNRGGLFSSVYVFESDGKRLVYAPCDIKPFPEDRREVRNADVLIIQPGIFETGLKHGFQYPKDHISRTTLYTFEETLALARRLNANRTVMVHLEEYWNRSYDDYKALEARCPGTRFAYDGMRVRI